ncbi:hypothetical protein COOONC_18299 [Cooperia oncophora]
MSSAGPSALRSQKGLLTRYCNNLKHLIDSKHRLLCLNLQDTSDLVYSTLSLFTSTVDALEDALDEEQEKQVAQYIDTAHSAIDRANRLSIQLTARLRSARGQQSIGGDAMNSPPANLTLAQPDIGILTTSATKTATNTDPEILRKGMGVQKLLEDFLANVHDQPLTNLQTFNYLLHSLQGEARDVNKRYAVNDDNYEDAISPLTDEVRRQLQIDRHLTARLESAKADSPGIRSQRRLLNISFPQYHNWRRNSSRQVQVHLFNGQYSRHLLSKNISEAEWRMQDAITLLDQLINTEERINDMTARDTRNTRDNDAPTRPRDVPKQNSKTFECMFCASQFHKSSVCT